MAAPDEPDSMPQWLVEIAIEPKSKADQEKLSGIPRSAAEGQLRPAPEDTTRSVIGDLNSRRGQILRQEGRGSANVIHAMVPLMTMFGYVNNLRTMSQGRATLPCNLITTPPHHLTGTMILRLGRRSECAPDHGWRRAGSACRLAAHCVAEPVIGRAFARPVARNDEMAPSSATKQPDGQITSDLQKQKSSP